MSPRPGGESDKFGNRYEGAWTVRHVLYVLAGQGDSITVEDVGDLAQGVEFTFRSSHGVEVHQLKRQHGTINNWSVRSLDGLGIWRDARHHVEAGREFHFVSTLPAQVPHELCDFARRSQSLEAFIRDWLPNEPARKAFDELASPQLFGSARTAWEVLRGTWIEWPDERDVLRANEALAGLLLDGASGRLAAAGLGELILHNLGVELTASAVGERLDQFGLRPTSAVRSAALSERIRAITDSWSASIERELLRPVIPRQEATEVEELAKTHDGLIFVVGAAGGGKTAVLGQAVEALREEGRPVLAFRLDRLGSMGSTFDLGRQLGLEDSPVAALAAAAGDRPSLLVVDQLDAVSLVSGRLPEHFDVVADLVREATAFRDMRIVLGCRKFDVDNDDRIRALSRGSTTATVTVVPLVDSQIDAAVAVMGLNPGALEPQQRALLRSPLHLTLLAAAAGEPNALAFQTSTHLFDAYWRRKSREVLARRANARFMAVISTVAEEMSRRQALAIPSTVLDRDDLASDAEVLISEHVLVRDRGEVAFFHEAFFDYAFARHWVTKGQSLVGFLVSGEQELFQRAQVRQIMHHIRESDPSRFVEEARQLLTSDDIRYHLKAAALAVIRGLAAPTTPEANMLLDVATGHPPYKERMWAHLRAPHWATRLDADGHLARWLRGDDEQQNRALALITGLAPIAPDRLVELLSEHCETPNYPSWVRWCVRFAELETSRPLFDLYLESVRRGHYDGHESELWLAAHGLADKHPEWVVELLGAALVDRSSTGQIDELGRLTALTDHDYGATELARKAALGAPRCFLETLLPYLFRVMELTSREHDGVGLRPDAHFSHRHPGPETDGDLGDVLFAAMASTIRTLAAADPEGVQPILEQLAVEPYDSAQWLLYQGLIAGRSVYADWAADMVLEGRDRLMSGYSSNSVWTTRELLQAISPHISPDRFSRLEETVRDLRFPWEGRRPGWYAFNLLSALEEARLSEDGRRRLGELRRAFGMDQPEEPEGITGGWIGPPIASDAASHMSDANWVQAIARHAHDREDFHTLTGGAQELSRVLREQVKGDPTRFALFALKITEDMNPAYGDALLMGLGDADPVDDAGPIFDAVRHIASLGHAANDRWLGSALHPYLKTAPLEVVELIRDRLVTTTDPSDDGMRVWSRDGSGREVADIASSGINTARGSLARTLAAFLAYDVDGRRTELAIPTLHRLANDPALPVRFCAAQLIGAAMRHARPEATEAFWELLDADDALLATEPVIRLLVFLGNTDPASVSPAIHRMLVSHHPEVREAAGQMTAFAAMEWGVGEGLEDVLSGPDAVKRKGAAGMAADLLRRTANVDLAAKTLGLSLNDPDDDVRKEAASVAAALRGQHLRPFEGPLRDLIASAAFADALPQLLITLERAPDHVEDLALLCAQRFVELYGKEVADIQTAAAGHARGVCQLIIRGLAQARTRDERGALLDLLDRLLLLGAYGVDEVLTKAERSS